MIASTSLIWDKNLLPKPSPFEAPFTRPAMSTKEIEVLIIFLILIFLPSFQVLRLGQELHQCLDL